MLVWVIAAAVIAVGLVYGGILLWTKVINKPEERLSAQDLEERLADGVSGAPVGVEGAWVVAADSELGYRVKEVLGGVDTEGVGRTNQVTGSLVIEGTEVSEATFEVDVASIRSDSDRRDGQFAGRIMSTSQYPTATFRLTSPIALGAIPAPGTSITASATGELTLRGVTRPVTFPLTARLDGDRIGVLGNIDIMFSDYGIANPSNSFVKTGDNGLLEFVLVFDRAPAG